MASGEAVKTEEYVPTPTPISSASAKSVSESSARTASEARMSTAPMPVLTVRGRVCRIASLVSRAKGVLRSLPSSSRTRSKRTTESLTE